PSPDFSLHRLSFPYRSLALARFLRLFFFFSSRRRHTRSKRDWSSDVCSSDLATHKRQAVERVFDSYPMLAGLRDQDGATLSGGQQQMLAIARALVAEPALLLLDEPNEGLAPVIVEQISELLDRLAASTTILFTEQNLAFALRHAQRGYILQKGRIVFAGSGNELRNQPEILEKYLSVA